MYSQAQAQRFGRYALLTSQYETQQISFSVGLDELYAMLSKIIRVADPHWAGKRMGGRISAVTSRSIFTLDGEVVAEIGDEITMVNDDGISETRTITSITGNRVAVSLVSLICAC
ncbi:tail protein [Xanthomonas phage JGB6]|nr:tail protein [Xanthomonas phage JGB6]